MTSAPSALCIALEDFVEARHDAHLAARKALGVSDLEARAIVRIGREPGIRPSGLRDYLGVTSAGVTTLVDRLVERGLARRELDADDRRVNHIFLEVDLETEPWSALEAFGTRVDEAIDAESAAATAAFAALLRRITERVRPSS